MVGGSSIAGHFLRDLLSLQDAGGLSILDVPDSIVVQQFAGIAAGRSLGELRSPLSLRPITVLPIPYRVYASLRCQSLLSWQSQWIHATQYAFCKGRSTTSMNSHLSFDLLDRYSRTKSFAGIQFDFC